MSCCGKIKNISIYIVLVSFALCKGQNGRDDFKVDTPTVRAIYPKGFDITLKDDGYSFVGYRINVNKDFLSNLGDFQIKKDIPGTPANGYYSYTNKEIELEVGDTIYYWMYVIKNGKGKMVTNFEYTVDGFIDKNGKPVDVAPGAAEPDDQLDNRLNPTKPSCAVSKTLVQGRSHTCKDELIFSEDFDKPNLEQLKQWEPLIEIPLEPDYPFNVYNPDKTVSLNDGILTITPMLAESEYSSIDFDERCTGIAHSAECKQEPMGAQIPPPVVTAKMTTRHTFSFTFGRVEVRAKLPYGSWLIPEINLEPLEYAYGRRNYESGLIHVAFVRGNSELAKKLYGGPVLANSEPFRTELLQEKIGTNNWYKDFHNYTLIWRPDGIDLLVDGGKYGTVDPGSGFSEKARKHNIQHASFWNKGTIMAPLDKMFYLTLGLRVGGVNDFDDALENKPWKNTGSKAMLNFWRAKDTWYPSWSNSALRVDYVRVYAL